MSKYIIKRILLMIPVILIVSILIFTIMSLVPGDPAKIILGSTATEAELAAKREELGLTQPYIVRLFTFLKELISGNLGTSYMTRTPVVTELVERFPRTLAIAGSTMLLVVIIGIPIGVISAVKQDTIVDRGLMTLAVAGVSIPDFWLALMLVLLFALKLKILPATGLGGIKYFILPCIAEGVSGIADLARQTRSSMLEVIRSDYVDTARAKGVSEKKVILKHAFPNALLPIISVLGGRLGITLGGCLVIEQVFSIPGIGMYMIQAVNNRDYPVVQGCVVFIAIIFSIVMLITDLCYAAADPLIKAQFVDSASKKKKIDNNNSGSNKRGFFRKKGVMNE